MAEDKKQPHLIVYDPKVAKKEDRKSIVARLKKAAKGRS